jgi:hypothetical protein
MEWRKTVRLKIGQTKQNGLLFGNSPLSHRASSREPAFHFSQDAIKTASSSTAR